MESIITARFPLFNLFNKQQLFTIAGALGGYFIGMYIIPGINGNASKMMGIVLAFIGIIISFVINSIGSDDDRFTVWDKGLEIAFFCLVLLPLTAFVGFILDVEFSVFTVVISPIVALSVIALFIKSFVSEATEENKKALWLSYTTEVLLISAPIIISITH